MLEGDIIKDILHTAALDSFDARIADAAGMYVMQEFPDFTHGEWKNRPIEDVTELPKVMLDNIPDA